MSWLSMPRPLLQRLLKLIPKLRAEDALLASTVAALGSGTVKNAKEIRSEWERIAGFTAAPKPWSSNLAALQAMGVEVEVVKNGR